MSEDLKARPKLDARGRASVFHFVDGWIQRQPVDCREIVTAQQGAAIPSQEEFAAWWNGLDPAAKASAKLWPEEAGPQPLWLRDVVMPPAAPAQVDPPAAPVAPASAPPVFADDVDKDPASAKPKK